MECGRPRPHAPDVPSGALGSPQGKLVHGGTGRPAVADGTYAQRAQLLNIAAVLAVYQGRVMAKPGVRFSEILLRVFTKIFGPGLQRKKGLNMNAPCPCGSGMKYKRCCLPKEQAAKKRRK